MRIRPMLAVLVLISASAFAQNFTVEFIGGKIQFGKAPLQVTISKNGGGTKGVLNPKTPPTPCGPSEAVSLLADAPFVMSGTANESGHLWNVEFVFFKPLTDNKGSLSTSDINWLVTGKYRMQVTDTVTGAVCAAEVTKATEYEYYGLALKGWPAKCPKPVNSPGQSPGLKGGMALRGHDAAIFPTFSPGGQCSSALATELNSKIAGRGFDTVNLEYKLTY